MPKIPDGSDVFVCNESFADLYLEDRRIPKYVPIRARFPFSADRRAANLDYSDPVWHRSFGGEPIREGPAVEDLSIVDPKDFSTAEYQFVSDAPHASNVPEGMMATPTGIVPIIEPPFSIGTQHGNVLGNPVEINAVSSGKEGGGEYYYAKNIETQAMKETPKTYFSVDGDKKMEWTVDPSYQAPVFPSTHSTGVVKRLPRRTPGTF